MKVIDLLNKIANGEEVPKKIKINGYIYEYQGDDYLYIDKNNDNHEYWLFSEGYTDKFQWLDNFLNTEVEIIKEDKPSEEIRKLQSEIDILTNKVNQYYSEVVSFRDKTRYLKDKLNELIKENEE